MINENSMLFTIASQVHDCERMGYFLKQALEILRGLMLSNDAVSK